MIQQRNLPDQMTRHHVPPKSCGPQFVIKKLRVKHEAYHTLFGNAGTLEECVEILRKEWWSQNGSEASSR